MFTREKKEKEFYKSKKIKLHYEITKLVDEDDKIKENKESAKVYLISRESRESSFSKINYNKGVYLR